jgi:radical SAM protein with 4Fe4S-binding SPASM domain
VNCAARICGANPCSETGARRALPAVKRLFQAQNSVNMQLESLVNNINELIERCKNSSLFAWSQGKEICSDFPDMLYICPTNICNHRCITCAIGKMRKGKDEYGRQQQGFMKESLFKKIVSELPMESRRIYLYKTGEALLHPHIIEMMSYLKIKRPSYEIALNTNAVRMTKKIAIALLDHTDYIGISIYGITKDSYKFAHRRDHFDIVLNNIDFLHSEYKRRKETKKIYFYIVRCRANMNFSDEEIFNFFTSRYPYFNVGINGLFNFYNILDDIKFDFSENIQEHLLPKCIIPYTVMPITWDGKIVSCIADPYEQNIMGDVSISSIQNVWNNEKYQNYRSMIRNGEFYELKYNRYLCKDCSWLFALKTHSTENLCAAYRRQENSPRSVFINDQPCTTLEYMELGLRAYLYGDISEAIKSFIIVERGSQNYEIKSLASQWKKYTEDVVGMRANTDHWESCLNKMNTTLNSFMISKYKISNDSTRHLHHNITNNNNNISIKKTEL